MSEVKDPTIKLFGKTIELPETVEAAAETAEICEAAANENSSNQNPICSSKYSALEDSSSNGDAEDQESQQSQPDPTQADPKDENRPHHPSPPSEKDSNAPPPPAGDSKEDDPTESSNSQDNKTLKKPDKILPCPRCNSMDTKFCYFNNYNVNQPRHFCRNCQRYWTAGGTMRNVAIGAGRRKNKNFLASQFRHVEGSSCARAMNPNDALVTFGSGGTPLCESMVSVLNIADRTVTSSKENNGDGCSSGSSVSSPKDEVPFFCGPPWPYSWQNPVQWSSPTSLPTFALPSFPLPFYSTTSPYWAGPSIWNGPFVISPTTASSSGLNSPILGKHSRDEETQKESSDPEKCLWAPKTSRIDDQGEVAKNSFILATLGTQNDDDCVGKSSLFKAFQKQPKDVEKTLVQENSTVFT